MSLYSSKQSVVIGVFNALILFTYFRVLSVKTDACSSSHRHAKIEFFFTSVLQKCVVRTGKHLVT